MTNQKPPFKNRNNKYLRFTGMGFQLLAGILLGTVIGMQLDKYLQTDKPYATAAGSLLGFFAGLYSALRGL